MTFLRGQYLVGCIKVITSFIKPSFLHFEKEMFVKYNPSPPPRSLKALKLFLISRNNKNTWIKSIGQYTTTTKSPIVMTNAEQCKKVDVHCKLYICDMQVLPLNSITATNGMVELAVFGSYEF